MADDVTMQEMPPRGHYLAHEVGRLAGVSGKTVGQWARRGYIRSSQSTGTPRVYSYQDVAEAMVVHALLEANVGHRAIKSTIDWLRAEYGHGWPLSHATLSVPADHPARKSAKRSIVVGPPESGIDAPTDHPVLGAADLESIAIDLRRGGWAARRIEDLRYIEVDPDRLSGRPVIAGLRVPAEDVARLAARPGGRKVLEKEYGLTASQIDDAVRWWAEVEEYEAA